MWRCLNDLFAYCAGEPQSDPLPKPFYYTGIDDKTHSYAGTEPHCKKDPATCGLYRTPSQTLPKVPQPSTK
jgi:hypothetical protein